MTAIALSVAAALSWGLADFGAGLKSRQVPVFVVITGMLIVGALGAVATLLLGESPELETGTALAALAAGLATAVGLTALYAALAIGPMSVVAPISAGGVMIPVIAGLAGGDEPSAAQLVGIALAIAGMLTVVALADEETVGPARGTRTRAVTLAVVGAIGLGVYFLAADAVESGQSGWFLLGGQLAAAVPLGALIAARRIPLPPRTDALQIGALGAISFAAWATSAAAVRAGELSLTSTISSMYPVVTVLLAVAVAGESLRGGQVPALAATFAGVALIAGG